MVILVIPIDKAKRAPYPPSGSRPFRDLLDSSCLSLALPTRELPHALAALKGTAHPVVTDSQAFDKVAAIVPGNVPLLAFRFALPASRGTCPPKP